MMMMNTYVRETDGAIMVEIDDSSFVNEALLSRLGLSPKLTKVE